MGNRYIMRLCEDVKLVANSLRKDKIIIEINDFAPHDVDITHSQCRQPQAVKDKAHGIKAFLDGQKISRVRDSKKVLEIHLGMGGQAPSKKEVKRNGEHGVKQSLKGIISFASSVTKEEVYSTQTTLNALHIIQNSDLKLAMEEHFAEIVIKLPTHMAITKKRSV